VRSANGYDGVSAVDAAPSRDAADDGDRDDRDHHLQDVADPVDPVSSTPMSRASSRFRSLTSGYSISIVAFQLVPSGTSGE